MNAERDRWRLHRGGVVNIWQYSEQTFDFSGGRAIFQGTNGSGKSRTLELLLPLCLDGDLRQLGSKGFDTVSIRRLMLDDWNGGPNRVGYAWIELHRVVNGVEEHLTCGLGVKASKTSNAITDSWRFITPARVGRDLQLWVTVTDTERAPLSQPQLREIIGADCLYEEAPFRAKIAESVYGVPAARYGDLLHLQRTLRNPDVGLKVLEGQLEQILSDALPPLDQAMIEQLATSFDDLESIRENITRLSSADAALSTFLTTYSDYAFAGVRAALERLTGAEGAVHKRQRESRRLTALLAGAREERTGAESAQVELETGEQRAEERIGALKELPAFRDLEDLRTREKLVDEKRSSAVAALEMANKQRTAEDGAVDGVLRQLRRLADDLASADELVEPLSGHLRAIGLDPALAPVVPRVPVTDATSVPDRVRAKPDPEADPLPVDRRVPPSPSAGEVLSGLERAGAAAEEIASAARQRGALALALHERAVRLEAEQRHVEDVRRRAEDARSAAADAATLRDRATAELTAAATGWVEAVARWRATGPLAEEHPEQALDLPETADLVTGPAGARTTTTAARAWVTPLVRAARDAEHAAGGRRSELRTLIDERDAELAGLRSGEEPAPPRDRFSPAGRDPATGSPFYRLVDFDAALGDAERAGLESALQACGLLDAWVGGDGVVDDPDLAGVFARAAAPVEGAALTSLLVPATEGEPVDARVVAGLLAAVSTTAAVNDPAADDPVAGGLSVSVTGRWSAGVLGGAWSKPAAEFIGAGARDAARRRRIAALEDELEALRGDLGAAESELTAARARVARWEAHLAGFPDDGELIGRHSRAQAAQESADRALTGAAALREELEGALARAEAARTDLARRVGEAGLPTGSDGLRQAQQAAAEAQRTADRLGDVLRRRCRGAVADLTDAVHRYHAAVADREAAEADAEARCVDLATQAAALTELTDAVGGEAREISAQLTSLESSRRSVRAELRGVRERVAAAREEAAKLEAQLEAAHAQLAEARETEARAAEQCLAAVSAPGVLVAALPDLAEDDLAAVRAAVAAAGERRGASEATVISKLQALQTSLAGSHDIAAEQHGGVLTVTVTGEEGPRPVAVAARRVRTKLAEQRSFLDESYQGIFADYLIRDLAEWLRGQIAVAEDLCRRMNEVLGRARSSQGVHVKLAWRSSSALEEETRQALALVRLPYANRTPEQDATLRRVFTERIEAERDSQTRGYAEILSRALDYRAWHAFTVTVADTGPDGGPRERRLRQLSSGETRLISYVTLFAAAASFYDAVSSGSDSFEPLRLVLLDEAFERLDDPTIARMLGLLVDLDMDWVITWPSGWGVSDKIPRMHIYDVLRPRNGRGVACTRTTWDGVALGRVDP
ncbi:TIGR02680 family protein [Umezawaea beigongshangensis]|uniref:TIGR02680 family protein n=1 Tax=Umezawaea beigongshangensis TaxID=2780383 RepID=UPI0018F20063|nr:TIGR02680 family protein [Umezawaea beigongshangensis]